MTRSFLKVFLITIIITLVYGCGISNHCQAIVEANKAVKSNHKYEPRLDYIDKIPILHLYGNHKEMGEQYGRILKAQLHELMAMSKKLIPKRKLIEYINNAKLSEYLLTKNMQDFLKGMSSSSGINYFELLALNVTPRVTCTTFSAWGEATKDHKLLMGRNADLGKLKKVNWAIGLIVVKHPDKDYATISSSFIGLAGSYTGINEKGVCFGNMLSYNSKYIKLSTDGLSIQLLMQEAAEKSNNVEDMKNEILSYHQMVPNIVMCADENEAIILEVDQKKSAVRTGDKGVIFSSNFFKNDSIASFQTKEKRYLLLQDISKAKHGTITLNSLKDIMHKVRKPKKTLQCIIFKPEDRLMLVSMNKVPATEGPFKTLIIDDLFKQ